MTEDERTVEVMRIHGDHSTCNTNLCHVRLFSERR
jgi:hypothetical protein